MLGLFLDIIGVIMLFRYGLPSKVLAPPSLELMQGLSEGEMANNKKIKRWAYTGLSLLILGFACQFAGLWLQ